MRFKDTNSRLFPVIGSVEKFDHGSGGWLERALFKFRVPFLIFCVVITVFLGFQAKNLTINASFDKLIPSSNQYIKNYFKYRGNLNGFGNAVRVIVESKRGTIFNAHYLHVLQKINDQLFVVPGVDRAWMRSLWRPNVRWTKITSTGLKAGPVISSRYDGSEASLEQVQDNVLSAGLVGSLVGNDLKSSTVYVPLLDKNPYTGKPLDYRKLAGVFDNIRQKYDSDKIHIRVVGFAQLVGDMMTGISAMSYFFVISMLLAIGMLLFYTRCIRSTALVVGVALMSVIWLLGIIELLGFVVGPFSVLVPFLVFAIACSHGSQKMNGVMQDIARGSHRYVASRYTFRRLFSAGLTAILCDVVGFAVLVVIDVPAVKEMALITSIGIFILVFSVLMVVPVVLSYTGVSPRAAHRRLKIEERETQADKPPLGDRFLLKFTQPKWALGAIVVALILGVGSFVIGEHLQVGNLEAGAPQLRPDSRYNRDVGYLNTHYTRSSDRFVVIVKTPASSCDNFQTVIGMDRLGQRLLALPGVQSVSSLATAMRYTTSALYAGSPDWMTINRRPAVLNRAFQYTRSGFPNLSNARCSVVPIVAYLSNHKAATLTSVMNTVIDFKKANDTATLKFLPAAGTAGIQAITNIVVKQSNRRMLLALYAATALLCLLAFRSWRAVIVAVIPLVITSIMCEALMVILGIGLKVTVLPVIALGVGVGVDYALYLLSVQLDAQRMGASLREAYRYALGFTGRIVLLVGFTLAAGVITWAWSPIKFQADMGILLTFMFLWNMVGALVLIPALSCFFLRNVKSSSKEAVAVGA